MSRRRRLPAGALDSGQVGDLAIVRPPPPGAPIVDVSAEDPDLVVSPLSVPNRGSLGGSLTAGAVSPTWRASGGPGGGGMYFECRRALQQRATFSFGLPISVVMAWVVRSPDPPAVSTRFRAGIGGLNRVWLYKPTFNYGVFSGLAVARGTANVQWRRVIATHGALSRIWLEEVQQGASGNSGLEIATGLTVGANEAQSVFDSCDVARIVEWNALFAPTIAEIQAWFPLAYPLL